MTISEKITARIKEAGGRFYACDNISAYLKSGEKDALIEEATKHFEGVIDALVIDRENDPNSQDTPRRLAKMYINELFAGRYEPAPKVTSFPNLKEDPNHYNGMILIRAELKSRCAHHWEPVNGLAFIGVIPNEKMIGLSKYIRLAQHCARRGTLQEELSGAILSEIKKATGSNDVAVYAEMTHGCCENRGVGAFSSMTQTTSLSGAFNNIETRNEFFSQIQLQKIAQK